jgi:hypothetical protein
VFRAAAFATVFALAAAAAFAGDEPEAVQQLMHCRNTTCLKDAYFELHEPTRGATFLYHARMLQLYPRNRSAELALLETLPRDEREATSLLSFTTVPIANDEERALRDALGRAMVIVYADAVVRHPEYAPRFFQAKPWLSSLPHFEEEAARVTDRLE